MSETTTTPEETATNVTDGSTGSNVPDEVDANAAAAAAAADGSDSAESSAESAADALTTSPDIDNVPVNDTTEASPPNSTPSEPETETQSETVESEPQPQPQPQPQSDPEVQATPAPVRKSKTSSSRRRKVYDIISMPADKSMDDFIKMVNDRLSSKKYVPIGGVTFDEHKNVYIQAISLVQPEVKNKKSTRRFKKY